MACAYALAANLRGMSMCETHRSHVGRNGTRIELRSGSEGPRHDPYGYEEWSITRADGRKVTVHIGGLIEWVRYDDGRSKRQFDCADTNLLAKFEACAGVSLHAVRRAYSAAKARRVKYHPCGQKHIHWVLGYPGEELLACEQCGTIFDSEFNLSAVI